MEDRRHIAVMFTDIVGYTALMGSDEDKAFDMLKRNHTIHATLIKKHNGTLIKEIGDGTLASFSLASNAVRCAMDIQREAKSLKIPLKIGIHEGEMVFAGADVLGDGVNIASRLQELSQEGCITISGTVQKDIKNKADINTKFIGDKKLKNVDEPVKVYKVYCEVEEPEPSVEQPTKRNKLLYYIIAGLFGVIAAILIWQFLPTKEKSSSIPEVVDKSIAVLPFRNDSPDEANEYFCNGTVEAILTNIQKIEDLRVKSRTSAEQYRNPNKDLTVIAKELNVAYILEGSVQKIGDNIRITAQLIDGSTGDHLWAENYDGKYTEEVLTFQSDVAKKIASSLQAVITPKEEEQIDFKPTTNMLAHDLWLKGHEMIRKFRYTRDSTFLKLALNLLNQALEVDPEYDEALKYKAMVFHEGGNYDSAMYYYEKTIRLFPNSHLGYDGKGRIYMETNQLDSAYKYLIIAHNLGPNDPWTNLIIGQYYADRRNDIIQAFPYYQRAYELGGGEHAEINGNVGWLFWRIGEYAKAEKYFKQAFQLRQECPLISGLHQISIYQGNYEKAIHLLDSICGITACERICFEQRIFNYLMRKDIDMAEYYYNQFIKEGGIPTDYNSIFLAYLYKARNKNQEANTILNKVRKSFERQISRDLNPFIPLTPLYLSMVHALLDENEESLNYLHELVARKSWLSCMDFTLNCPFYEKLWDDPEFKALVRQAQEERAEKRKQVEEMIERGEIDL